MLDPAFYPTGPPAVGLSPSRLHVCLIVEAAILAAHSSCRLPCYCGSQLRV